MGSSGGLLWTWWYTFEARNFVSSWETISFWRRPLLNEVSVFWPGRGLLTCMEAVRYAGILTLSHHSRLIRNATYSTVAQTQHWNCRTLFLYMRSAPNTYCGTPAARSGVRSVIPKQKKRSRVETGFILKWETKLENSYEVLNQVYCIVRDMETACLYRLLLQVARKWGQ
jgi:hypothetical protein